MINNTIEFKCKVITPMFLHGADNETPELRAPSIKGAMRFWWRACNGHLSLVELKKAEDAIFGSTSGRSCFGVRVKMILDETKKEKIEDKIEKEYKVVAHHTLLIKKQGNFIKNKRKSKSWKVGSEFEVTLTLYKEQAEYNFGQTELISLFQVVSYLGGLGKRNRRGNGSFRITNGNSVKYSEFHELLNAISIKNQDTETGYYFYEEERDKIVNNYQGYITNYITSIVCIERIEPFIENVEDVRYAISQATHNENKRTSHGYGKFIGSGSPRLSSTVIFGVNKEKDVFAVISTKLRVIRNIGNMKNVIAKKENNQEVYEIQNSLIQEVKEQLIKNDPRQK